MKKMMKLALATAMVVSATQAASAAIITRTYTVASVFPVGSPVIALTNVYTLTYDPTLSVDDRAVTSYTTSSTAPQFAGPIGYSTFANSTLILGKNPGVNGVTTGTNDFYTVFGIDALGNVTSGGSTVYTTAGTNTFFNSTSQTAVMSPLTVVPEPASWAMIIGGVGLVGGAMRRRQSKVSIKVAFA